MSGLLRHRSRGDAGFSLIELLITVVTLGVITIPLGNLIINFFTNSTTTTGRLSESHDEQIAAAYFAQDASSVGVRSSVSPYSAAQSIWTDSFPAGSCGLGVGTPLILIKWDDKTWNSGSQTETATVDSAGYYIKQLTAQNGQLHRVYCVGATQQSDVVLAHDVNLAGTNQASCSSTCTAASLPATVTLRLAIKDPAGNGQPYDLTLTGQRRQS